MFKYLIKQVKPLTLCTPMGHKYSRPVIRFMHLPTNCFCYVLFLQINWYFCRFI